MMDSLTSLVRKDRRTLKILVAGMAAALVFLSLNEHNQRLASDRASCERGNALRALSSILATSQLADLKSAAEHAASAQVRVADARLYVQLLGVVNDPKYKPLLEQRDCT